MTSESPRSEGNGRKILFIAQAQSSHTHAWIDLLAGTGFDVRLFGIKGTAPAEHFPYEVITTINPMESRCLVRYSRWRFGTLCQIIRNDQLRLKLLELLGRTFGHQAVWSGEFEEELLASTIRQYQPDIIHTLGIEFAALPYMKARKRYRLQGMGKWVVTAWGGSDFELHRHDPEYARQLSSVIKECDFFIADNEPAYLHAKELGLDSSKIIQRGITPGAGGVEVDRLRSLRTANPSKQRTILIPKAYECQFSKILPVFEAIKACWEQLSPCKLVMTAGNEEAKAWFRTLPGNIQSCSSLEERIPHEQLINIMAESRVVLAPSLIDGIPNTLYESMATGAFPVFSPLETFRNRLKDGQNILYARNLYPIEISEALVKAMNNDDLVDSASELNLHLVRTLADRSEIKEDVIKFYNTIGLDQ